MLNVIMLSVVMLSVVMLSVVMLSVVMLSVVAPKLGIIRCHPCKTFSSSLMNKLERLSPVFSITSYFLAWKVGRIS